MGRPAHTPPSGPPARLQEARELAGLRQRDLAEAVGLDLQVISRYERGATRIPLEEAARLAAVLGVGVEWLATGEGRGPVRRALS